MFGSQKPEMVQNIAVATMLEQVCAMFPGEQYAELVAVLGALRGLSLLHQTHHWQSFGPQFYGDHLLYERLYNDIVPQVDATAEKIVGLNKASLVGFEKHVITLSAFLKNVKVHSSSDDFARRSLEAELMFIDLVEAVMDKLKVGGLLTRGLEQHLGNIADKHEEFVYLLKRRVIV
jgi:DNA-binding ferritin-like protein